MRPLLTLFTAAALCAADLPTLVRQAMDSSPITRGAVWGIQVVELDSGKSLFNLNPNRFFVPASNTKLYSTALGLERLGPNHTFRTTIRRNGADLVLYGGGDPNLSGRVLPYQHRSPAGNPLASIEDLANQVAARGIARIDGDIVGDDSYYVWEPYPHGWAIDDPIWEYGAPVSALTINDNTVNIAISPGKFDGDLATIALSPAIEYYQIDNRVRTLAGAERRVTIERLPGERQLRIYGTLPPNAAAYTDILGIDDPALFAAQSLYDALTRRGIAVGGRPVARHWYPSQAPPDPASGEEVASRTSAPLLDDLRVTAKVSQNLHAELVLRAVAKAKGGSGRRVIGLQELSAFLAEAGADPDGYNINDGSGLSRLNLITPNTSVKLLTHMWKSANREAWLSILPVGGVDGTLSTRFANQPAGARVHAKTGSLSHVAALAGYIERKGGGWLAFSIMVNNFAGPASEIRAAVDKICIALSE